jgi:hypothetical protein
MTVPASPGPTLCAAGGVPATPTRESVGLGSRRALWCRRARLVTEGLPVGHRDSLRHGLPGPGQPG